MWNPYHIDCTQVHGRAYHMDVTGPLAVALITAQVALAQIWHTGGSWFYSNRFHGNS